jgi:transposase
MPTAINRSNSNITSKSNTHSNIDSTNISRDDHIDTNSNAKTNTNSNAPPIENPSIATSVINNIDHDCNNIISHDHQTSPEKSTIDVAITPIMPPLLLANNNTLLANTNAAPPPAAAVNPSATLAEEDHHPPAYPDNNTDANGLILIPTTATTATVTATTTAAANDAAPSLSTLAATAMETISTATATNKKRRGRPKGSKNKKPRKITAINKPKQKRHSFEERFMQLSLFHQQNEHCNVPKSYDASLCEWVKNMKYSYANRKIGKKTNMNLSQERIDKLEELGLNWTSTSHDERFTVYCHELIKFKKKFGHCNVPWNYAASHGLGTWCNTIRVAYNAMQRNEEKKEKKSLTQERIDRLEEIGFEFAVKNVGEKFKKQCAALIKFREDNGHCNVPQRYRENPSLGQFCTNMRVAYNCIQNEKKPKHNLTQDRIGRLEEIGLKWKVKDHEERFEKHCEDLEAFREKYGHCNVSKNFTEHLSLATWCHQIRFAYHQKSKGKKPGLCVSQDRIERLETIGFKWFPNRP